MRFKMALVLSIPVLCVLGAASVSPRPIQEERNLLTANYPPDLLERIIAPADEWQPYPKAGDLDGWAAVPEEVRTAHIRRAEEHLGTDWETPLASVFMEYVRTGNRTNYQNVVNRRRTKLAELILGECMEGDGRFLDDIMNGVWTICEETYWGVPAHISLQRRGSGLPDVTEPTVDLFAAETGTLMAWTYYLVGDELDRISPLIKERIHHEVQHRIISVNLEREDFWWMGFGGRTVNNWNPWICSNWLTAVLILEEDPERRIASIHKILQCLDHFLNPYPADGGCDEGPGYWGRAGGSLFDCLELLQSASAGEIDIFDEPLVAEIGRYIYRAYIGGNYFINFADAAARLNPDASLVYRYGRSIGDESMTGFGALLAERQGLGSNYLRGSWGVFGRVLPTLFNLVELLGTESAEPLVRDLWLPELQVMAARSREGSNEGFYLAAKGGHNAESHNHNDVGNFILYADGFPAIIDVGVETYTAKTFSGSRYEIWTMQSAYHNLPTINGVMQRNGGQYRAADVEYLMDHTGAMFILDIAGAYPEEAGVRSYTRMLSLNRDRGLELDDRYELAEVREPLVLSLMTWRRPVAEEEVRIRLESPAGEELDPIYIDFHGESMDVVIESIPLEDGRLRSSWGEEVYRIQLIVTKTVAFGELTLRIHK